MSFPLEKSNGSLMRRAVVRENNDPDKLGRVRVEYPWFHGNSSEVPSEWARLLMPYASEEHGSWSLPEVGDEVLVYFENGNLDFPIVMGSLYSNLRKPPTSGIDGDHNSNNQNTLRFMKTKSGHTLAFDDSDGKRGITLKDKDNRRLEIQSADKKIILSDENDNCITIDGPNICLKNASGTHVSLDSSGVTIHATASIKLGEAAAFSLIKGELFQAVFNSHMHGTAWGPSTPPMMPMTPAVLSTKTKTE